MSTITAGLPLTETIAPASQAEVADVVARAAAAGTPIYPLGGGCGLDFGLPARRPGWGLQTAHLRRVVDYPARDMTITVEAGITMAELSQILATERQRLPIDAPQAVRATLGGVISTNTSGPRRYGCGTIRDYVIGISAVDGRGTPFKAGGRVVKNVAGYDFCKLLTGAHGALAVITQVTLKLRPLAGASALVVCDVADFDEAEARLAALVRSAITPTAIEWLLGPAWRNDASLASESPGAAGKLVVGLEGTRPEVEWMTAELRRQWQAEGVVDSRVVEWGAAELLWSRMIEFTDEGDAPLVVKAGVPPSAVTRFVAQVLAVDPNCSIAAHAGNGLVLARLSEFAPADASRVLIRDLQPAAARLGGHCVVLACPAGVELTRQAVWGGGRSDAHMMRAVKRQFDPQGLFNPGRSSFEHS